LYADKGLEELTRLNEENTPESFILRKSYGQHVSRTTESVAYAPPLSKMLTVITIFNTHYPDKHDTQETEIPGLYMITSRKSCISRAYLGKKVLMITTPQ
jgi:hypothetical protein